MMDSTWKTSSYTQGGNCNCVEARMPTLGSVEVRDSNYPDHGHLTLPTDEWRAFLAGLGRGDLD